MSKTAYIKSFADQVKANMKAKTKTRQARRRPEQPTAEVTVRTFQFPRFTQPQTGHPVTDTMLAQLGGRGLHSAYVLTGGQNLLVTHAAYRSASRVDERGYIHYDLGISWKVNAGQRNVKLIVTYETGSDTYTVRLWKAHTRQRTISDGTVGEVVYELEDVQADSLIEICDSLYTRFVNEYMNGFIPL